ncbi:MAG: hypothetical protein WCP08_14900, partial [Prolixibacteraceae bacterium]
MQPLRPCRNEGALPAGEEFLFILFWKTWVRQAEDKLKTRPAREPAFPQNTIDRRPTVMKR